MIIGDFEVFAKDWLLVAQDVDTGLETVVINDPEALRKLHAEHKDDIWLFYNGRNYDQWIFKAILCGFNPKAVNDYIIEQDKNGATYSSEFKRIQLYLFDIMTSMHGLKTLEGFMGSDIRETTVPFDIDRKLTPAELNEVVTYCRHDVQETFKVFNQRKEEFTSQLELTDMFNLGKGALSLTKAQISAKALGARRMRRNLNDEFNFSIPTNLQITKYSLVIDWFMSCQGGGPDVYKKNLSIDVAGVPHIFAWGGLHGAIPKYHDKGVFINCDVASFYPTMMIKYGYVSRAVKDPAHYADIYHKRLTYKAQKDKRQQPLKIVLNSTYGAMKDKYNPMYDPLQANNVCVTGQLLLLDLIEHVEQAGCAAVVQSNTDGVLFKLNGSNEDEINDNFYVLDDVCFEWEQRTGMSLEFDEYCEVWQKDVNNYVVKSADGKYKSKGAYVKKLNPLDNDLPIINRALLDYMTKDVSIEETINNCHELIMFQKIVKVSSKYKFAMYNGERLSEKTFRIFASKNVGNTSLYKVKSDSANPEKFANCAEHIFIDNSDVTTKKVPFDLDRQWYIDLAKRRLEQFI